MFICFCDELELGRGGIDGMSQGDDDDDDSMTEVERGQRDSSRNRVICLRKSVAVDRFQPIRSANTARVVVISASACLSRACPLVSESKHAPLEASF
jgi:hypothetical protein